MYIKNKGPYIIQDIDEQNNCKLISVNGDARKNRLHVKSLRPYHSLTKRRHKRVNEEHSHENTGEVNDDGNEDDPNVDCADDNVDDGVNAAPKVINPDEIQILKATPRLQNRLWHVKWKDDGTTQWLKDEVVPQELKGSFLSKKTLQGRLRKKCRGRK